MKYREGRRPIRGQECGDEPKCKVGPQIIAETYLVDGVGLDRGEDELLDEFPLHVL